MTVELEIAVEAPDWSKHLPDLEGLVRRVVDACLAASPPQTKVPLEVSFLFCDAQTVRTLNASWRSQDKATNVLSFPAPYRVGDPVRLLGDVALSLETVESESQSECKSFSDHTTHLLTHGVLHLLGYDHEAEDEANEMESLERAILASLGIPDPYESETNAAR